jgi:hypothetical protein
MNLLFLPGNDKRNLDWSREINDVLRPLFSIIRIVSYRHWQTGAPFIDMEFEKKNLPEQARDFSPYMVLAKSVGVLLALECIKNGTLTPDRCIFLGTAVRLAKQQQYPLETWLQGYCVPTLWIQKDEDPACCSRELSNLLKSLNVDLSTFVEIPGNIHHYEVEEVRYDIENYVNG